MISVMNVAWLIDFELTAACPDSIATVCVKHPPGVIKDVNHAYSLAWPDFSSPIASTRSNKGDCGNVIYRMSVNRAQ